MVEEKKMTRERFLVKYLNNYFKKRSKPLTEGTYEQFKKCAETDYDRQWKKTKTKKD